MIYHVSPKGNDFANGTQDSPFKTINHAAQIAIAGDTVIVHEGVYREHVNPKNGGYNAYNRITYKVADGEHAVIKGSEVVTGWEKVKGTVWKKTLPNSFFGNWNPFALEVFGDWLRNDDPSLNYIPRRLGDVYINGASTFEAIDEADLYSDEIRTFFAENWHTKGGNHELIPNPERTLYRWLSKVTDETTTIFVNFRQFDPNEELIEINVRESCFYPTTIARNYITVSGFEMAQCACRFTPPTSEQRAMLGVNWAKGWIIENNILHDAKCSAISIGKEASTGDNDYSKFKRKHSHYYQLEATFRALKMGWSNENVGSHLIRNNEIYDCGQNGIVGNLGCVFSVIEHNHIYNIATKHEFFGHEIAGIKLHAPIDVIIRNNCIHDCTLGTWIDWQDQGLRVTKNLFYDNNRDFFVEVSHGPCTVDNNIFLSPLTIQNVAQGTAFVHNILGGNFLRASELNRQVPYHFPHSTDFLGVAPFFGYDDRIINNIILCLPSDNSFFSTIIKGYENATDPQEYLRQKALGFGDVQCPKQPLWLDGNAYAKEYDFHPLEKNKIEATGLTYELTRENDIWFLIINAPSALTATTVEPVTTARLGAPVYTEEPYENPDGSPIDFTIDILGETRSNDVIAGPFANLNLGTNKIPVWKK